MRRQLCILQDGTFFFFLIERMAKTNSVKKLKLTSSSSTPCKKKKNYMSPGHLWIPFIFLFSHFLAFIIHLFLLHRFPPTDSNTYTRHPPFIHIHQPWHFDLQRDSSSQGKTKASLDFLERKKSLSGNCQYSPAHFTSIMMQQSVTAIRKQRQKAS